MMRLCAVLHLGKATVQTGPLIAVVQEAFVKEVSTRKIERLTWAMVIENISVAQVSEFNEELDTQVADFRGRPLEEEHPFL